MRKHNYLVGYEGDGNCAYGVRTDDTNYDFVRLLTLTQAKRLSKEVKSCSGKVKSVVYKLVKVKS